MKIDRMLEYRGSNNNSTRWHIIMFLLSFLGNLVVTQGTWAAINPIGSDHESTLLSFAFAGLVFTRGRFLLTDQLNLIILRSHASGSEHLEMPWPFHDKKKCHQRKGNKSERKRLRITINENIFIALYYSNGLFNGNTISTWTVEFLRRQT